MLLQKTGLLLKEFISHRRNSSLEESGNINGGEIFTARKKFSQTQRRRSWLTQTSASDLPVSRRASISFSNQDRGSPQFKLPTSSTDDSLCCSCREIDDGPAPEDSSLSKASLDEPSTEILYLDPLSSPEVFYDAKTWRLIFSKPLSQLPASNSFDLGPSVPSTKARISTFDLLEALSIEPIDDGKPVPRNYIADDLGMEDTASDVGRLIQETDRAFQAVGVALEDAKAASRRWHEPFESSQVRDAMVKPLDALPKKLRNPALPSKTSLERSLPMTKTRSQKTIPRKKIKNSLSKGLISPARLKDAPARWTLNDVTSNVADVITGAGRIFRTDVDEILTPNRIQKLKEASRIGLEHEVSEECNRSSNADNSIPAEPSNLEATHHKQSQAAAGKNVHFIGPNNVADALTIDNANDRDDNNMREREDPMEIDDLTFPSPPRSVRSRSNSRAIPPLPTIPEVLPFTLPIHPLRAASNSSQTATRQISLPSTPFTLTSPLFRHGPIRVDYISKQCQDQSSDTPSEQLDWTAFQIAITGTMNDANIDEAVVNEWDANEMELDDIMRWWESFGFDGCGRLVKETPQRSRRKTNRKRRTWRALGRLGRQIEQEAMFDVVDRPSIERGDGETHAQQICK